MWKSDWNNEFGTWLEVRVKDNHHASTFIDELKYHVFQQDRKYNTIVESDERKGAERKKI